MNDRRRYLKEEQKFLPLAPVTVETPLGLEKTRHLRSPLGQDKTRLWALRDQRKEEATTKYTEESTCRRRHLLHLSSRWR